MSRIRRINLNQFSEAEKKAIPSKVFFNHFYAIYYHLVSQEDRYNLKAVNYFNILKIRNDEFDLEKCRKLLWNSWSTEYAFNLASTLNNDEYYKYSLHWNFPQAYYSVYLSMTAFHETQGTANDNHEKSIKLFGNSVKDGHYPNAISFFSRGLLNEFEFMNLSEFDALPDGFSSLSKINSLKDAHYQIASFLKSTRTKNAENKRKRAAQSNDRRFLTKSGVFRKSFNKEHWDVIYTSIPETTILNMMYRLRIKANYQDIETFMNADIDFKIFNKCFAEIVNYMNYIHEAYIFKVIGKDEYIRIFRGFKKEISKEFVAPRLTRIIANA